MPIPAGSSHATPTPPAPVLPIPASRPLPIARFMRSQWLAARLRLRDRAGYATVTRVRRDRLTFLGIGALIDLYNAVRRIESDNVPGMLVEAGCALGGSGLCIAQARSLTRPFYLFDAFGMIPPPSNRDGADAHARYAEIAAGHAQGIQGSDYYGYRSDLLDKVIATFRGYGFDPDLHPIHFVQGYYEETLAQHLATPLDTPIAFAHIDCDWYDSVRVCLEEIVPRLSPGGVLVIDDYHEWSGCRAAVDDYFQDKLTAFAFEMKSRLHITRIKK